MSVIAVKGIPWKWPLRVVSKSMLNVIKGRFELLNFEPGRMPFKTCYLRLSMRLDPIEVIETINKASFGKGLGLKFTAFIPDHVPDFPLAPKPVKQSKKKRNPNQRLPTPQEVLRISHEEVMAEVQSKFPGLYNLSRRTGQKLLDEIARTIFARISHVTITHITSTQSSLKMTKAYRKVHPHFGDFQLILSTLHRLQDAAGVPRTQVCESELVAVTMPPVALDNLPFEKVQAASKKYTDSITKKITEHVQDLNTDMSPTDSEEDIARKKVRQELKKMGPLFPALVRQVILKQFIPEKSDNFRMRIYGEPFLPTKEAISPFIRRYQNQTEKIFRSKRMFNMVQFTVPPKNFQSLMAMDGTVLSGAKLVIRSSDMPRYEVPTNLMKELMASCGYDETWDSELIGDLPENWDEN